MTSDEFVSLVKRLEVESARNAAAYRRKVVALGWLAYVFVGGVVVAALGTLGALGYATVSGTVRAHAALLKLDWLLLGFVYAIGRSLWVRLDPPEGIELEREKSPELFKVIDEIRERLGAPAPHQVLLVDSLNAAIYQYPRLGMLGWYRNTLVLGWPLMKALTADELRAVIAHEFGHMAGNHGRAAAWIYRARRSWSQLLERMEANHAFGAGLFRPFFRWYAPYFNAYSFVLARQQEYEADRFSASATSSRTAVDALVRLTLAGNALDGYWQNVWGRSIDEADPVSNPYSALTADALTIPDGTDAERALAGELAAETGYADTHPSLRDRAAAIGESPRIPPPVIGRSADALLGQHVVSLATRLDSDWRAAVQQTWRERHETIAARREQLESLESRRASEPLKDDDAFHYADLVEDFRGPEAALPLFQSILDDRPAHVSANISVGRILLAAGDAKGLAYLDLAVMRTHTAILPCWRAAYEFLRASGRNEEAERWLERARQEEEQQEAARAERSEIPFAGDYRPHGLDEAGLKALQSSLVGKKGLERAWFVRRRLKHFDEEEPQWVLCVKRAVRFPERKATRRRRDRELLDSLENVDVPGDARILVVNHQGRGVSKIYAKVPGAQVFPA